MNLLKFKFFKNILVNFNYLLGLNSLNLILVFCRVYSIVKFRPLKFNEWFELTEKYNFKKFEH